MTFAIYAIIGVVGAFLFLALYTLHPMTRNTWWRSGVGRNLTAYSAVMFLIYVQAMINRWAPSWPLGEAMRTFLGLAAIVVVWWRLAILVREILKWRKKEKRNE